MSTYLDNYGTADARREHILKVAAAIGLIVLIVAGALYFLFRDYREERQVKVLLEYLSNGDYKAAYALWGCTEDSPCRDYSFEKFIEDWGPDGYGNVAAADITDKSSCEAGIIQTIRFQEGDEVLLWVDREDRKISFAPWQTCHPRLGDVEGL